MIVENAQQPVDRLAQRGGRIIAYRGLQDLDDDWTEGVTAAARAARNELMLTGILQGGDTVVDAARATAMRQLRLLREMRARGMRTDLDVGRALRAELEVGAAAGEPCPILTEDWQLLDDMHPGHGALLDLDLKPSSGLRQAVAPGSRPTLLRPGTHFHGHQCVNRGGIACEDWQVSVRIEECDWATGYICGSMTAENVPQTDSPVSTFFEGNIVGAGTHTFLTEDWGADKGADWAHWQKFSAFQRLQQQLGREASCSEEDDGSDMSPPPPPLPPPGAGDDVVFMRWKEKSFETGYGEGCGLTIAGFYYVTLDCVSGVCEGFYFDSFSQPFQKLVLKATPVSSHGFSSSAFRYN